MSITKLPKKYWKGISIFSFDTETTHHIEYSTEEIEAEMVNDILDDRMKISFTPNESSQLFLAGLQSLKTSKYLLSYENVEDIFINIKTLTVEEGNSKAVVFAHNASYDLSYIIIWLLNNGWKQTLDKDNYGNASPSYKEFYLLQGNNKFFSLTLYYKGVRIEFRDSLKLFPVKLEELGETVGYKKLKDTVDYTKFEINKDHNYPEEWLTYLKRDVEILTVGLIHLYFKEKKFIKKALTASTIAYSYLKDIIKQTTPDFTIEDYDFWERWYKGGFSSVSLLEWGKWNYAPNRVKMFDIVSSYPNVMVNYNLPFGEPSKEPKPYWKSYCAFYIVKIKYAIIKKEYQDMACIWKPFHIEEGKRVVDLSETEIDEFGEEHHINNKYQYLQEVRNKTYYLTDVELEMWNKLYNIKYTILDTFYFETSKYMSDIVHKLYMAKEEAKKAGLEVDKFLCKTRVNSLYGKMGQKWRRQIDWFGPKNEVPENYVICSKKDTLQEGYNVMEKKEPNSQAHPVFIGAYITALARVRLLDGYKQIVDQGGKWILCDTDSLAFIDTEKGIKLNNSGSNLGQWELEKFKQADAICALCPKQYRIVTGNKVVKSATAGVSKEAFIKEVKNQDYNYDVELTKKTIKKSKLGNVVWDSPFNFQKWKGIYNNPICPKNIYN